MCGLFKRRTAVYCPNCGHDIPIRVKRLGCYEVRRSCFKCGLRFKITSNFGVVAIRRAEEYKGYGSTSQTEFTAGKNRIGNVGNVTYWKEHHGDNWRQVYDEWKKKDDEWWKKYEQRRS